MKYLIVYQERTYLIFLFFAVSWGFYKVNFKSKYICLNKFKSIPKNANISTPSIKKKPVLGFFSSF